MSVCLSVCQISLFVGHCVPTKFVLLAILGVGVRYVCPSVSQPVWSICLCVCMCVCIHVLCVKYTTISGVEAAQSVARIHQVL